MRKPSFFTFGVIWLMAAAVSFILYVQNQDPAALVRCGIFMLFGVIYLHMDQKNRRK